MLTNFETGGEVSYLILKISWEDFNHGAMQLPQPQKPRRELAFKILSEQKELGMSETLILTE